MTAVFQAGGTALITGSGSGVGFATAKHCRKTGMNVYLLDISADNLSKAKSILSDIQPSSGSPIVSTHTMDVSDAAAWASLKKELPSDLSIDFLMLNAGTGYKVPNPWENLEYFHRVWGTNLFGPVNGIATFLSSVTSSSDRPRAIVLTGSKQGITNPPLGHTPAYNSSKAAVKSLAEHLSFDLHTSHPNIKVYLLIPGWAFTGLSGNVGPNTDEEARDKKPKGAWFPSQVAEYLVDGMSKNKFYIVCPDNDVDEATDAARMEWGVKEINEGRQPLTRWRNDETAKKEAADWIAERSKEIREKI